ncbi:MAG: hypothetical protein WCE81_10145 [Halobacteriota archaeon]
MGSSVQNAVAGPSSERLSASTVIELMLSLLSPTRKNYTMELTVVTHVRQCPTLAYRVNLLV